MYANPAFLIIMFHICTGIELTFRSAALQACLGREVDSALLARRGHEGRPAREAQRGQPAAPAFRARAANGASPARRGRAAPRLPTGRRASREKRGQRDREGKRVLPARTDSPGPAEWLGGPGMTGLTAPQGRRARPGPKERREKGEESAGKVLYKSKLKKLIFQHCYTKIT